MCSRPWSFERVPNKMLKNLDHSLLFTSTKEHCLAMCLNEVIFKSMEPLGGGLLIEFDLFDIRMKCGLNETSTSNGFSEFESGPSQKDALLFVEIDGSDMALCFLFSAHGTSVKISIYL